MRAMKNEHLGYWQVAAIRPTGLKGWNITAQGMAQRRPGSPWPDGSPALKGRHNLSRRQVPVSCRDGFALSGLVMFWNGRPRATPWAVLLRPVGASDSDRRGRRSAHAGARMLPDSHINSLGSERKMFYVGDIAENMNAGRKHCFAVRPLNPAN
jgi:hypothetical protein